jgi:hypothetical protein
MEAALAKAAPDDVLPGVLRDAILGEGLNGTGESVRKLSVESGETPPKLMASSELLAPIVMPETPGVINVTTKTVETVPCMTVGTSVTTVVMPSSVVEAVLLLSEGKWE